LRGYVSFREPGRGDLRGDDPLPGLLEVPLLVFVLCAKARSWRRRLKRLRVETPLLVLAPEDEALARLRLGPS
jgi:hypothetical protein